jgi:hypothetical protein
MFNLGALDVVIALVVVLVVLSLVVQSVQQLVKKVLKLKSNTIQRSLEDLLGRVVTPIAAAAPAAPAAQQPGNPPAAVAPAAGLQGLLRRLFTRARPAETLATRVIAELGSLGRRSLFNKPMLDSIAKEDVQKVLTKIGAGAFYPDFQAKFQQLQAALDALTQVFETVRGAVLAGSASAKLAALEQALAPLRDDLAALRDGQGIKATAVLGDLLAVRRLRMADAFALLGEVQDRLQTELAAARAAGTDTAALQAAADALRDAADKLKQLGERIEEAVAPLAAKLEQVDLWYDTVMQGFNERYTRNMKTVAVAIAVLTVIGLNANFFALYQGIANDPKLRGAALAYGEKLEADRQKPQPTAATTPPAPAVPAAPATAGSPSVADVEQAGKEVATQAQVYEAFGFRRLHRDDVLRYWCRESPWGHRVPGADGTWHWGAWGPWLGNGLNTLLGWLITILLLSAGAPFWEDVLETLFGLKSMVRQKTATKNVETGEGGQPKP